MLAHQLHRELEEILYRLHANRQTVEEAAKTVLAVCDGFTDSKMKISDVVVYAVGYLKPLPYPRAVELSEVVTSTHQQAQAG